MPPPKKTPSNTNKQIKSIMPAKAIDPSTSKMMKPPGKYGKTGRGSVDNSAMVLEDIEYVPFVNRTVLKPDDQLALSSDDLKEDIARLLSSKDPQQASNIVEYSFRENAYIPAKSQGPSILLFTLEGSIIAKDSEEAHLQMLYGPVTTDAPVKKKKVAKHDDDEDEDEDGDDADTDDKPTEQEEKPEDSGAAPDEAGDHAAEEDKIEEGAEGDEGGGEKLEAPASTEAAPPPVEEEEMSLGLSLFGLQKKVWNQFNFCERAALTYNNPFRDMQCQTLPPCIETFSSHVMQWIIFDSYQEDYDALQKIKEAEAAARDFYAAAVHTKPISYKEELRLKEENELKIINKTFLAAKAIERMINQNIYDDIAQDFRYWEDPADNYCEEGTLLPLWKFTFENTSKQTVTSICWNPCYYDFFAVSYGYYSFSKLDERGAVCLFTLKNPSYPEFICYQDSCVMSVDVHPKYPQLIVLGLSDGNVSVFNIERRNSEPQFVSDSHTGKHGGIVWQVKWGIDTPDDEINFFSISSDGNVYNWLLNFGRLDKTLILPLTIPGPVTPEPDGTVVKRTCCGCAIAFHPTDPLIFLAGTEEGHIYKCSVLYCASPIMIYYGHRMPIHRLDYNTYYPSIFLSCSADWRIKIWEDGRAAPLFMFDLGCSVGDVEWAPFSSTLFAACLMDGKVCVYDLNINKYEPTCVQHVVSKKRNQLTRIAFNNKFPFLVVGDDKGCITALKLSPNLRKKVKPPKKGPPLTTRQLEIMKLEKILMYVCEPPTISIPESESPPPT